MSHRYRHYRGIVTVIFFPRGVIAKLHSVPIMLVSPGGLDQCVFTVINNCIATFISMVVAQLVNVVILQAGMQDSFK